MKLPGGYMKMKLTILGTGNAKVTKCYNTCFTLNEDKEYFMIDGGGGSTILKQLEDAGISWKDISTIFVTHKHIDHLLGIIWMLRMYCQGMARGQFDGEVTIYGHDEVIGLLKQMAEMLLTPKETKFIGEKVCLEEVKDGEERMILGHKVTFFDILSTKAKQFGFCMEYADGKKLTCCGDEPYNECEHKYAVNSTWILHEAFCLFSQADKFKPYEKHHSTVKDACQLAQDLNVDNLILYHTEDKNISRRKELYTEEGRQYYKGNLLIPDDLETFEL
jgi:ribonuclease Z